MVKMKPVRIWNKRDPKTVSPEYRSRIRDDDDARSPYLPESIEGLVAQHLQLNLSIAFIEPAEKQF
jgi:hypothetical protein